MVMFHRFLYVYQRISPLAGPQVTIRSPGDHCAQHNDSGAIEAAMSGRSPAAHGEVLRDTSDTGSGSINGLVLLGKKYRFKPQFFDGKIGLVSG